MGIWQSLLGHKPITAENLKSLCLDNTGLRLASLCTAVRGAFRHTIQEFFQNSTDQVMVSVLNHSLCLTSYFDFLPSRGSLSSYS